MKDSRKQKKKTKEEEPLVLSNLKFLIVAFREGLGMYDACRMTGNTPQEVSKALVADPKFRQQIDSAIQAANFEHIKKVTELRDKGKYAEAD